MKVSFFHNLRNTEAVNFTYNSNDFLNESFIHAHGSLGGRHSHFKMFLMIYGTLVQSFIIIPLIILELKNVLMAEGCRVPLKAGKHTQRHTHTHIQNDSIANIAKALKFITWERKKKVMSVPTIAVALFCNFYTSLKRISQKRKINRKGLYFEKRFLSRENFHIQRKCWYSMNIYSYVQRKHNI